MANPNIGQVQIAKPLSRVALLPVVELDLWSDANVIGPLFTTARDYDDQHTYDRDKTVEQVKKAIRTKVLPAPARKEWRR